MHAACFPGTESRRNLVPQIFFKFSYGFISNRNIGTYMYNVGPPQMKIGLSMADSYNAHIIGSVRIIENPA